jgi:hypothetical protein
VIAQRKQTGFKLQAAANRKENNLYQYVQTLNHKAQLYLRVDNGVGCEWRTIKQKIALRQEMACL